MKIRVTNNEPLKKAMNKANLVLVEVPVNTKHGQHRSHRWKRAIDALNQLFQDLGKKANAKDITFIDKNTNQKVGKEELIEDYEKKGKQENKTLQAFVAENYKVSTEKEEKSTNTKQSIKESPENQVLYEETPKNETETMYSKNKYKRETFTGTFSCGHEGSIEVGGYSDEYRQQAALGKFEGLCPHCQQKKIEEEREKEREEARKVASELNLPDLKGSEKQIKWALSIRNKVVEDLKPSIDYAEKLFEKDPSNMVAKAYAKMGKDFINIQDSSKWIDYRELDFKNIMINVVSGYNWNDLSWYGHFISDDRRLDKNFLFDYNSLPKFENEEAERMKNTLCNYINEGIKKYLRLAVQEESSKSSEMIKWINEYQSIAENTNDELYYESLEGKDFRILGETRQYRGKLSGEESHESILKAYKKRNELIMEFITKKKKGKLSEKQDKIIDAFFQSATESTIYNYTYADATIEEIAQDIENRLKEDNLEVKTKKQKNGWTARLRYGTKRIESKKEYAKAENFEDFSNKLEKLKDLHTDIVGRAALDMAGIDVPLYVKRNGGSIKTGKTNCLGYCSRGAFGTPVEVAIVDNPSDRAHSYKTTVHETMHALFGTTTGDSNKPFIWGLQHGFEEGLVEIAACASLKKAYGKDYMEKDRRSYEGYVAQTLLRLKKTKRFKGKTLSEIGRVVSEAAFENDGKTLSSIKESLNRSVKNHKDLYEFAKEYDDINRLENATKRKYSAENNGDMTNFEKTELAMFIDRLKNTDLTLKEALESKGDTAYLALVLLYNILDEEDDELLGLL